MIEFEAFVDWAMDRFNGDVIVRGNEVKLNSIFTADNGHHMWCNTEGGKHQRENGCYRCFYTEEKGTLTGLVMQVDSCTFEEALNILAGHTPIGELEEKLDKFFENQQQIQENVVSEIQLPPYTYLISDLAKSSLDRMEAETYLDKRKLSIDGLMYCVLGDYKNRIIIPYYDREGKLIYFNGRHVGKSSFRYMGPPKSIGVGKGDVVYATHWPEPGSKVNLTEGELDARTLTDCSFNGTACGGKVLSEKQIEYLRDYKICLCLDGDYAGLGALIAIGSDLLQKQFTDITFVRPPQGIKDWNKMLCLFDEKVVRIWINEKEKPFDEFTAQILKTQGDYLPPTL